MDRIENRTYDELRIGETASLARTLTDKDIELFAIMSGDVNPAHVDPEFAKSDMFHKVIAHGMWGGALISTVLGTELPGPGTIYLGQTLRFMRPVGLGDTVTVSVKVVQKSDAHHRVTLDCAATNQHGETVIEGVAEVIAPTEKISRERVVLPEVEFRQQGHHYQQMVQQTKDLEPIRTAVVDPVETVSLLGPIEAAKAKLIVPVMVGPEAKIRAAADQVKVPMPASQVDAVSLFRSPPPLPQSIDSSVWMNGHEPVLENWTRLSTDIIRAAAEISQEIMVFSQCRLQSDMDAWNAMASCRNPAELFDRQRDFAQKATSQYFDEASKLTSRVFALVNDTTTPLAGC